MLPMVIRLMIVFAGVVALMVGIAGLLVPVSVSADRQVVRCGSPIAPDLSAARTHDDASAANVPVLGEVVTDTNFTRLCRKDLEDRRLWTITLAVAGTLVMVLAVAQGALSSRERSSR